MTNKRILVLWCFYSYLYFGADAGKSSRNPDEELPDDSPCNFSVFRIYDTIDLLRCINAFMIDLSARGNAQSLRQSRETDSLAQGENLYESSFGDLVSGLLDNSVSSINDYLPPVGSAVGQYHLNRQFPPGDLSGQFGGLGVNLYDALSSISRYDDSKCVPRILCEMASGRPPGEHKQASSYLGDLGRNALLQWLSRLDLTETSPVLSFARAAALGYSSGGEPTACYRAFPRCPRDPGELVHYLNNHNGGFFRLFGGHGRDRYPQQRLYASQGNSKFPRGRKRKALPSGHVGTATDRIGTGKLKLDVPVPSAQRDYGESFFREEYTSGSSRRVVFPAHEEPNDRPSGSRSPKSSPGYEDIDGSAPSRNTPPFFFPQDSEDQDVRVLRFAPYLPDSESREDDKAYMTKSVGASGIPKFADSTESSASMSIDKRRRAFYVPKHILSPLMQGIFRTPAAPFLV